MAGESTLLISRLQTLAIEVYKCMNNISPSFICNLLTKHDRPYNLRNTMPLCQKKFNTKSYGLKSFTYFGSKIWNKLPLHIKRSMSLNEFKQVIKHWDGENCCEGMLF